MAKIRPIGLLLVVLGIGSWATPVRGQAAPNGLNGLQLDPAMIQQIISQFQQRMMDNLKEQLECSDDEFKVLQPLIEKVVKLRLAIAPTPPQGFGGRGGRNPLSQFMNLILGPSEADLVKASTSLQEVLDQPNSPPDLIRARVIALRDARANARNRLDKTQDELRDLLTVKQESVLVLTGLLD